MKAETQIILSSNDSSEEIVEGCPVETTSDVQKEKKKRSWKKPVGKPKRPLSAYNIFFQLERDRIVNGDEEKEFTAADVSKVRIIPAGKTLKRKDRKIHGQIAFEDLARTIGSKWKKLSDVSKSIFQDKAKIEKLKYEKEVSRWKQMSFRSQIEELEAMDALKNENKCNAEGRDIQRTEDGTAIMYNTLSDNLHIRSGLRGFDYENKLNARDELISLHDDGFSSHDHIENSHDEFSSDNNGVEPAYRAAMNSYALVQQTLSGAGRRISLDMTDVNLLRAGQRNGSIKAFNSIQAPNATSQVVPASMRRYSLPFRSNGSGMSPSTSMTRLQDLYRNHIARETAAAAAAAAHRRNTAAVQRGANWQRFVNQQYWMHGIYPNSVRQMDEVDDDAQYEYGDEDVHSPLTHRGHTFHHVAPAIEYLGVEDDDNMDGNVVDYTGYNEGNLY